jgi:MFS family permease
VANVIPGEAAAPLPETSAPGHAWPRPAVAWYAVFVLSLTLLVNFMDRGIINLLAPSIQSDLNLSDTQMGLILGFAFAVFYAIVGLPIAWLVDRASRKAIITIGVTLWSGMTALTGLATNFGQLFAARVGVGVGEACTGPATFSMLADYFPREKLARAIAVLNFGYTTGIGVAAIVGGLVIAWVAQMPAWSLPGVGELNLASWQRVLILVGLPGLIVSALMLTVPEPVRRAANGAPVARHESISIPQAIRYLLKNWTVYGPMLIGVALKVVQSFGFMAWGFTFFQRTYGWDPTHFGVVAGTIFLCVWPLGSVFGAWLAERWTRKGLHDANLRVVVWSSVLVFPMTGLMPLMPTGDLAMIFLGFQGFIAAWVLGPQNAALQIITPNQMRGQVSAVWLFTFNLIGVGLGPVLVGLVTDHVFRNPAHLNYSVSLIAWVIGPIAAWVIWLGMKPYGEIIARMSRE